MQLTPARVRAIKTALPQRKFGDAVAADSIALSRTMQRTLTNSGATGLRPVFTEGFARPDLAARYGLDRFFVADVPQGSDTPAIAAALAGLTDDVENAAPVALGETANVFPNDFEFDRQWSLYNTGVPSTGTSSDSCPDNVTWCAGADIDAPSAWKLSSGSSDLMIAIVDSGVSPHPEFGTRLLTGRNVVFGANPSDTSDGCPHGTHVAGIAAAGINDGSFPCSASQPETSCGIAGVNGNAKILPVRVLTGCSGTVRAVADGVTWAADQGADIINISLQFYNLDSINQFLIENALNYAVDSGSLIIAAAGNGLPGNEPIVAYPGVLPQAIAVSATTACDELATINSTGWKSNFGPEIEIAAPGDDIYSTWTSNSYRCIFGTSMATPHVTGVASLVKSLAPDLSNVSIRNILTATAVDLGEPGWDQRYGYGRLDAYGALLEADTWPQMLATFPPSGSIDARRPHLINNPFAQQGWQQFDASFRGDSERLVPEDFTVVSAVFTPLVATVAPEGETVTIQLNGIIPERQWTTISHEKSGTYTRLGFLPGDVNGNGVTGLDDLEDLKFELELLNANPPGASGPVEPLPLWSTDIDRSGKTTPADLIELINLMNGAGTYEPYLGRTLSPAG